MPFLNSFRAIALSSIVGLLLTATVLAQNPVPFIDQPIVPSSTTIGSPGLNLTINGAGFVPGSVVNWNDSPLATTYVSAAKLFATVPAQSVVRQHTDKITVMNPSPGGGSSNVVLFSVTTPTSSLAFRVVPVTGVNSPIDLVAADFNHDGRTDLAVISSAPEPACHYTNHGVGSIVIFLASDDGTFTKRSTLCYGDGLGKVHYK